LKLKNNKILTISHGANFRGTVSFFGLFVIIAGLFLFFFNFDLSSFNNTVSTLGYFAVVAFGFNLFLGFEGVQLNLQSRKVREYYSLVGMKLGMWYSLDEYQEVVLTIDRFTVTTSTPYTLGRSSAHKTFDVILIRDGKKKGMLLSECKSYDVGKQKLEEFSKKLKMPARDACIEELQLSKKRRADRLRRGRR
jgi:hypothetical protein